MTLINCPDCGKQVSDEAETCPTCGYAIIVATAAPLINCPQCGHQVSGKAAKCDCCGSPLQKRGA